MNLAVVNPNFSIIVPSDCNASCDFCFWELSPDSLQGLEYLKKLNETLQALPAEFNQCSITGGEPTTSPILRDILMLARLRFDKVVLTSNGYKIEPWIFDYIDHLNISRHHFEDYQNEQIFKTFDVPSCDQLLELCENANDAGVDVTLNTVLDPDFDTMGFIYEMVEFAKSVNASNVCFRKCHDNLEPLPVESHLTEKVIYEHSCGVCLIKNRLISGMKTTWRYSVEEPSKDLDAVYELIFQPNGDLTSDWKGENQEFSYDFNEENEDEDETIFTPAFVGCGARRGC